ncbi:thiamine pyrophosphate-dependent enzyme [Streptomyces sp. NPDC002553]|uniref:thiamine pyrophosphate-dependent enzyme n=1 Tax=Streptomyces sp. NPDC002553 TaxID=3154417 RepID=UPI00331BD063
MARTVARVIVDALSELGVRQVFGVVGDALNPLTDAIRTTEGLEWVGCRHEEAAAFAASAQSQLSGTLGVCMGTVGPGSVHLLNGLYDAAKSHTPVLAIAGQVPLAELGTDYFQEVDNDSLFSDVGVFRATITSPGQLPQILETAVRHALGRKGVAVLTVPGDLGERELNADRPARFSLNAPLSRPEESAVRKAAALLDRSERVTLLVGRGARGAREDVLTLADRLADDDAVFTSDTGMATVWLSRFVEMRGERRLIGSYNLGSMANAMPQALGAQCLDRERQVVAFCGDGGLSMLLGDLMTLKTHRLPVKLVVFDNRRLGMVKLEQEQAGLPEFGTVLDNPDFAAVATAMGLPGIRVTDPTELETAVRRAFDTPGPVLLDVLTNPDEIAVPAKPTVEQGWGFAVAKVKEIVRSHGDDSTL